MTRFLAIHGVKRRRVVATIERGLIRDSAAWFVLPRRVSEVEFERTLAAAAYLALAPATRSQLATMRRPGAYTEYFASAEELMPAVLFFADEPTGQEEWHRYLWPGPPRPGATVPYTKVARAARPVPLCNRATYVAAADRAILARAEALADQTGPTGSPPAHLTRIPAEAPQLACSPDVPGDKLTRFCAALAAELRSRAAAHIGRLVTEETATAGVPK